jgi:hypothetical protein
MLQGCYRVRTIKAGRACSVKAEQQREVRVASKHHSSGTRIGMDNLPGKRQRNDLGAWFEAKLLQSPSVQGGGVSGGVCNACACVCNA